IGTPLKGETIGDETFDGKTETAVFPGDLPVSPETALKAVPGELALRFVRFRPPKLERSTEGVTLSLPHIRLDRALQFLLGDRLA
ncbi:MAG: YcjX family protein, partial [Hyphomicrobiales bacterium]|nr:YcjX family protein [Hyphomicrobiales bacterium]